MSALTGRRPSTAIGGCDRQPGGGKFELQADLAFGYADYRALWTADPHGAGSHLRPPLVAEPAPDRRSPSGPDVKGGEVIVPSRVPFGGELGILLREGWSRCWPNTSVSTAPVMMLTGGYSPDAVADQPTRQRWAEHGASSATKLASPTGCTTCATTTRPASSPRDATSSRCNAPSDTPRLPSR